jgi:predicted transcriptional regulator
MNRLDISQLPVLENGVSVGSIRESSIIKKASGGEASHRSVIKDLMDDPLPSVNMEDRILRPLNALKEKNAIVVLDDGKVVDIITTIDVINIIVDR